MQELRDSAEDKTIRLGGFDLPILALSNEDMAGFSRLATSGDRLSTRDREQEMFGAGFSFAQCGADPLYAGIENNIAQVYLAANITPELPGIVPVIPVSKDQQLPEKAVTAQSYEYRGGLPTLVPSPEQLGLKPVIDLVSQAAALELEQKWSPLRGNISVEMNKIPDAAWHQAYEKFPQFKESGLTEQQTKETMQAIIRNELYNYDLSDKFDDDQARRTGNPLDLPKRAANDATLGNSQLSVNAVLKRAQEYPEQIGHFKGHEVEALLDPQNAPLLVAATLAHNLEMYQRHHVPITQQTLGYSYNPPNGHILPSEKDLNSEHAQNIMHQLKILQGLVQPTPGER